MAIVILRLCALCAVLLALPGCQVTALQFMPTLNQKQFFNDGSVAVASELESSTALIATQALEHENGQRIKLALLIQNTGASAFDIDTANVTVHSPDTKGTKVYSYDDLVNEEKRRRTAAIVLTAIAGGVNAYNASQASTIHTSGTFSTNTGYGSYSGTVYDPLRGQIASQLAAAETRNNMTSIANRSNANLSYLKGSILKRTTVFPAASHGGEFVFEAPALKADEIRTYYVTVRAGEETHQFVLTQRWKKSTT